MNYRILLWDIDGTVLNFLEAEKCALRACFAKFAIGECTDEMIARYSDINRKYWEALERGEVTKQEVLVGRYRDFFAVEGIDMALAEPFNEEYQVRLGDTCIFCDNAFEIIKGLHGKVKQYAVTNGTAVAQERKLKNSKLDTLLDGVFISDKIGHEKPTCAFFNAVFEGLNRDLGEGTYTKNDILIIGDSLSSDIRGGNNAGICTCWYNPTHQMNNQGVRVDYEIADLNELSQIIGK